jgi:hypothetical protein
MRYELKLHRFILGMLLFLLGVFVVFLLRIRPSLADERLEVIASLAIVVLAATVFSTLGMIEGTISFQFGTKHKRELWGYLLLGFVSLASGLYLAISETVSVQIISLVAAPHALLFGLGELRIAQHLGRHPVHRRALFFNGSMEMGMGIALLFGSRISSEGSATLLDFVPILSILQLLPLIFYSNRMYRTSSV